MRRASLVVGLSMLALCTLVASCGGKGRGSTLAPSPTPTCQVVMDAPVGFAQSELAEDPYQDHVGVRVGYVDDSGRELHVFSGIPGEFGEGLPQVDQLSASGSPAALLGRGKVRVLS